MDQNVLVREVTASESARIGTAKTGDKLPDGSVLLRRRDMDHMGLERFRIWVETVVLTGGSVLALLDEGYRHTIR